MNEHKQQLRDAFASPDSRTERTIVVDRHQRVDQDEGSTAAGSLAADHRVVLRHSNRHRSRGSKQRGDQVPRRRDHACLRRRSGNRRGKAAIRLQETIKEARGPAGGQAWSR